MHDAVAPVYDAEGFEILTYRIVYYLEIGYIDGGGMGRWEKTVESVPFTRQKYAEEMRDIWVTEGKLKEMSWGGFRPMFDYGACRIRRDLVPVDQRDA